MDLTNLRDAKEKIETAQAYLRVAAEKTIGASVRDILSKPHNYSVVWAAKSSEYNDEGMYPGISGPYLNVGVEEGVFDWDRMMDDRWEILMGDGTSNDPALSELNEVLSLIGEEILSDIFGDEHLVVAYLNSQRNVQFDTEYAGV